MNGYLADVEPAVAHTNESDALVEVSPIVHHVGIVELSQYNHWGGLPATVSSLEDFELACTNDSNLAGMFAKLNLLERCPGTVSGVVEAMTACRFETEEVCRINSPLLDGLYKAVTGRDADGKTPFEVNLPCSECHMLKRLIFPRLYDSTLRWYISKSTSSKVSEGRLTVSNSVLRLILQCRHFDTLDWLLAFTPRYQTRQIVEDAVRCDYPHIRDLITTPTGDLSLLFPSVTSDCALQQLFDLIPPQYINKRVLDSLVTSLLRADFYESAFHFLITRFVSSPLWSIEQRWEVFARCFQAGSSVMASSMPPLSTLTWAHLRSMIQCDWFKAVEHLVPLSDPQLFTAMQGPRLLRELIHYGLKWVSLFVRAGIIELATFGPGDFAWAFRFCPSDMGSFLLEHNLVPLVTRQDVISSILIGDDRFLRMTLACYANTCSVEAAELLRCLHSGHAAALLQHDLLKNDLRRDHISAFQWRTAMVRAARRGDLDIVRATIDRLHDATGQEVDISAALTEAIAHKHVCVVQFLLPRIRRTISDFDELLHAAVRAADPLVFEGLCGLYEMKAREWEADRYSGRFLINGLVAAAVTGRVDFCRRILAVMVKSSAFQSSQVELLTPTLDHAASDGFVSLVTAVLDLCEGSSIWTVADCQWILTDAAHAGQLAVVSLLVRAGFAPRFVEHATFQLARQQGDAAMMKLLARPLQA